MKIGLQLYSGRNSELATVLSLASRLGYSHVEGYGGLYPELNRLRALLNDNGLTMPTAHVSLADLEDSNKTLALARQLGMKVIVCPIIPIDRRPSDAAGWSKMGERLERLAKLYNGEGYVFAYHNHAFEFIVYDRRFAMDLLLEAAPSVVMEADIAWMTRGGADVRACLEKNGKRIIAVHVKDLAPPGQAAEEDGWADVGHGVLPWDSLATVILGSTAVEYIVAEHDKPSNLERFASRSIAAIRSSFAGQGNKNPDAD